MSELSHTRSMSFCRSLCESVERLRVDTHLVFDDVFRIVTSRVDAWTFCDPFRSVRPVSAVDHRALVSHTLGVSVTVMR